MAPPPKNNAPKLSYSQMSRLGKAKSREFTLQSLFKYGYRNKEDISNLPPETLVLGSQNVLTNAAELVTIRQGYQLDGSAGNQNDFGIDSSYDFAVHTGVIQNLRKWGTNLEMRYLNPATNLVSWINILATLNSAKVVNFTSFWDQNTELKTEALFVNGDNKVYVWSGGVGSYASSTAAVAGTIATAVINATGSSYVVGDVLTLTTTGSGGTVKVLTLTAGGAIQSIQIITPGSGYSAGSSATSGGTGTGATITITVQPAGTLTVSGTQTTDQLNFLSAGVNSALFKLLIDGTTYTYTAVSGETFLGVFPDPSLGGISVGDAVIQKPSNIVGGNLTGLSSTAFNFDLISTLNNQVWYGSLTQNNIYVSKTNNFTDVSFSTPRLPAEGALLVLDANAVGFSPQASNMYISAGRDQWWISQTNSQTVTETAAGNAIPIVTETLYVSRLKTARNQGAQSQGLVGRYKNSIIYVSNEQIINALGLVKDIYTDPQVTNLSDPIKYDVDAYSFAGGQIDYDNYFIYALVPAQGILRMFNVQKQYWEAPQTIPVSRLYHLTSVIGDVLYGHSSLTNESYELFTGYNDNGNPINSVIAFPYVSSVGGSQWEKKSFNKMYTEGYISSNTTLMLTINYDFGGFSGSYTTVITGSNAKIIFNRITDGSIGRNSLGSEPVGSILNQFYPTVNPKFRVINTMPRVDCYEYQIVFSTDDVDFQYAILRTGPAVSASSNLATEITF